MAVLTHVTRGLVTANDFSGASGFAEVQTVMEAPPFQHKDADMQAEARALGLDPDAIAARAIQDAIRAEKARRWQEENRAAMEAQNAWIEQHGLPLTKYRMF